MSIKGIDEGIVDRSESNLCVIVDKVVYRRENSLVQEKVGHDELAKIRSGFRSESPT